MTNKILRMNSTPIKGEIEVPGDKSISHRAVMFGAIAKGKTRVNNFLLGEDCLSTISCFRKLGVDIQQNENHLVIEGRGLEGLTPPKEVLDVGNSGTTIRLILGILSGLPFESVLVGDESIGRRPMTRVTVPLIQMGAKISGKNEAEYTPLTVKGSELKGIRYELPIASAQVKSALLLAGLHANGETTIIENIPSRDHTERMIKQFGGILEKNGTSITVRGNQQLKASDIEVPGDISSAAFFLVAAAITPGSDVLLKNVGVNPTRTGIIEVLKSMGAKIEIKMHHTDKIEPTADIRVMYSELEGITIRGQQIPKLIDEIPIIALLATQAKGNTIIRDAAELKVKETNRIDTVVHELKKLGAQVEATDDGMIIHGKTDLIGGEVSAHGDHRIGMMLSIASLICSEEVKLHQSDAVAVSYPRFFDDLNKLTQAEYQN